MKSLRWVLIQYDQCSYKKENYRQRNIHTQREENVKTQTARRWLCDCSEASVSWGRSRVSNKDQKLEETRKDAPLKPSEKTWPCWQLDFRILAPRTVGQYISVVSFFFFFSLTKTALFILWLQYLSLTTRTSLLCFPSSKHSLFQITHILIPIILLRIIM